MVVSNLVAVLFWVHSLGIGRVLVAYGLLCLCAVFVGKEGLLLCGVSDDMYTAPSFVRWLFGGCMVGLLTTLVVLFVPLFCSSWRYLASVAFSVQHTQIA